MVNRNRIDIIADILTVASRDAKKTRIKYQANLSNKVFQRYLSEVIEASLIKFENCGQFYKLTYKGQKYLDTYKDYARCSRSMEKRLNDFSEKKKVLEGLCPVKQILSEEAHKDITV